MRDLSSLLQAIAAASVRQTARTASNFRPNAAVIRSDTPPTEADIKEAMGFDRNDPNVKVRFVAHDFGKGGPLPSVEDESFELDGGAAGGVTAPVTDAALHHDEDNIGGELGDAELEGVLEEIVDELNHAQQKHPAPFNSAYEGYGVLHEQVVRLAGTIFSKQGYSEAGREAALRVASAALRYVLDLEPGEDNPRA